MRTYKYLGIFLVSMCPTESGPCGRIKLPLVNLNLGVFLHVLTGVCVWVTSSGSCCTLYPLIPLNENEVGKDQDWMNSLVTLRLLGTSRWVLALQLRSFRSVQINLHSALMWPVSITLASGGRCVCFTSESLLSADTVRQLQTDSLQQRPDGTRRPFHPESVQV